MIAQRLSPSACLGAEKVTRLIPRNLYTLKSQKRTAGATSAVAHDRAMETIGRMKQVLTMET